MRSNFVHALLFVCLQFLCLFDLTVLNNILENLQDYLIRIFKD